jgi:hypothetical protein
MDVLLGLGRQKVSLIGQASSTVTFQIIRRPPLQIRLEGLAVRLSRPVDAEMRQEALNP